MHIVVIGGGIAGISAAYELAAQHRVILLEREPTLAYHTTGRSAAIFTTSYGSPSTRPLTAASREFFDDPPSGLAEHPLLTPLPTMMIGRHDQESRLREIADGAPSTISLDAEEAAARCPVLRKDVLAGAVIDPASASIDVSALHQAYVRGFRQRGGLVTTSSPVVGLTETPSGWHVATPAATHRVEAVVNASGAWGDEIASLAGVDPVGLVPLRRTAFTTPVVDAGGWPMVVDADEDFYFKPEGPGLLCSPGDETPSPPCDARPAEIDVALGIERINQATTLGVRHVRSQWAGLRTFAPDREMVIGCDPRHDGFWWFVGQGGTGIQTAPAAARVLAALVDDAPLPSGLTAAGFDPGVVAAGRTMPSADGW